MKWLIIIFSFVFIFSWIRDKLKGKKEGGEKIIDELRQIFAKNPRPIYRSPKPIVEIYKGVRDETK
jgi:hypothetical protein